MFQKSSFKTIEWMALEIIAEILTPGGNCCNYSFINYIIIYNVCGKWIYSYMLIRYIRLKFKIILILRY